MADRSLLLPAVFVALGLTAAGALVASGIREGRARERWVTVKGLAEQPVEADLASWPISFILTGDDLAALHREGEGVLTKVRAFLTERGFQADEIRLDRLEVNDKVAQSWNGERPAGGRFAITQTVVVRTTKVRQVEKASREVGALLGQGVVLARAGDPTYSFTRLNDVKPAMLAAALASAREGAEQFATESQARLTGIRRANQGVFSILPRDEGTGGEGQQVEKTVRVVSTIEYLLED